MRAPFAGLVLLPALALAACSSGEDPGAITADQQRQLNDAAAMLDANSVALETVSDSNATGHEP